MSVFRTGIYRVIRPGVEEPLYEGTVDSLKQGNEFVTEAKTNTEVGIALPDKAIKFKPDDLIEVYEEVLTKRHVNWKPPGF